MNYIATVKVNVNMTKDLWVVTEDNVRYYNNIIKNNGSVQTLDYRPYVDLCSEFDIPFKVNIIG